MHSVVSTPLWAAAPFAVLLLAIALVPLISHRFWARACAPISITFGVAGILFYLGMFGWQPRVMHTGLDYFSFIVLLASLFTISGGILIRIEGRPHPAINAAILFIGALISNIIGTTGASMLLVRPYLHINRKRLKGYLVVFFIFVVSNVGGALTPIGDPPLFLGYLKGVPFFWVISNVWAAWIFAVALIIAVFFVIDLKHHRGIMPFEEAAAKSSVVLKGWYNFFFLAVVIFAVFKTTPLREVLMIAASVASYLLTPRTIHKEHHFQFGPIKEVAVIFFAIFATMMPALDWLELNAGKIGLATPGAFYWATGALSSFLDNAPTYLSMLSAAIGFTGEDVVKLLNDAPAFVKAISLASVFFGACTYIGNGPNFMVKAIADHYGAKCPSFVGYMFKYSIPILLPIFFLVWLLFIK